MAVTCEALLLKKRILVPEFHVWDKANRKRQQSPVSLTESCVVCRRPTPAWSFSNPVLSFLFPRFHASLILVNCDQLQMPWACFVDKGIKCVAFFFLLPKQDELFLCLCLPHPPCRWIKFEEKVEKGGERWSKPHVATLALHSLMELKSYIETGTVMLDMEASTLPQVVGEWAQRQAEMFQRTSGQLPCLWWIFLTDMITDNQIECGQLKADLKEKVVYTLLRKHRHQTKKSNLRSLADIGKSVSSASRLFSSPENGNIQTESLNPFAPSLSVQLSIDFLSNTNFCPWLAFFSSNLSLVFFCCSFFSIFPLRFLFWFLPSLTSCIGGC